MYSSEISASGIGVLLIDSDNCIFGTADGARGVYVTGSSSTIGLKLENSDGNSFGYSS